MRNSETKYKLVQSGFAVLGYPSLEEACAKEEGFAITREPHEEELERIKLLEAVAQILLVNFLDQVELPPCKIIKDEGASWRGLATCIPLKHPITVSAQMPIRYQLAHIALKRSLLLSDDFGAVLSSYLHEIAHMFGPEGSASFSKALTVLLEITLCNTQLIEYYHKHWRGLALST